MRFSKFFTRDLKKGAQKHILMPHTITRIKRITYKMTVLVEIKITEEIDSVDTHKNDDYLMIDIFFGMAIVEANVQCK